MPTPAKPIRRKRVLTEIKRPKDKTARAQSSLRCTPKIETKYVQIVMDCSRLASGIYQGARPVQYPFFADAVVNVENILDVPYETEKLKGYLWAPIEDKSIAKPSIAWLDWLINVLICWRKLGWSVLIHCTAGRSRSTLISAAYFMKTEGCGHDVALYIVRMNRIHAMPNTGFMETLQEYETFLRANG